LKESHTHVHVGTVMVVMITSLKPGSELWCFGRVGNSCTTCGIRPVTLVTNPVIMIDGLRCSERVSSSCSTSGIRRVNLVTNPVISREWGKDWEVFTTSGTYPWSFVTQIFHNGQPSHGGDRKIFEVMISTLPKGTLGSVASLLAA